MARKEYRAVFSSPQGGSEDYGPIQNSLKLAVNDTPADAVETHRYASHVEVREVQPWEAVPLKEIMDLKP